MAVEILYAEPNRQLRNQILSLFSSYRITTCETISECLLLARRQRFDLYLLDLDLLDGSGFRLCLKIRAFDANTPIVVTSLHDSDGFPEYAVKLGAQSFWSKRENPSQLKFLLEKLLLQSRVRSREAKKAEFDAIQSELERQREIARKLQAEARALRAKCQERRIMIAAYRAFSAAGGSRAQFDQMWPQVYARSLRG